MTNTADPSFRHYSTKHLVVSWVSRHVFDHVTYKVRHGMLKGMKRKGGLGWLPESIAGEDGSPEQIFWANLKLKDKVVYDVGAFHGLLTLHFARQAKRVISYEPNSSNHARLIENVRLNGFQNVTVRKLGAGAETGAAIMAASPLMTARASVESSIVEALRNSNQSVVTEQINIVRLDDDIRDAALPAPDFIKIDIEGQELAALQGARETILTFRPQLFLEMHGQTVDLKRKKVKEIVEYLYTLGYREIRHVETGTQITSDNSDIAAEGHLFCPA